ncbi:MAG: iron-containing alcohol dehydrogenase [Synergistaceae bacterium]|nr:iron-containing alcohol dehydrogenase [Synergistaceae bacterium]
MRDFTWHNPTTVIFGRDTVPLIADHLAAAGVKRVLLLYGGGAVFKNGAYSKVVEALGGKGIEYVELGGVKSNPTVEKVREGVARAVANPPVDAIVPVGGGSVFDSAKAIALGARYAGDVWDLFEGKQPAGALPIFGVLTVSATSSEVNDIAVLSNQKKAAKTSLVSPLIYPRVSVIDPSLQTTVPEAQMVSGGIDIMSHVMERVFDGVDGVELMDEQGYAMLRVMMRLIQDLRDDPADYDARAQYAWAGSIAHSGSLSCGRGNRGDLASHKLGHSLSLLFDTPHGMSLAVMMPAWARYVARENPVPFARFAEAVFDVEPGDDEDVAFDGIDRLEDYFRSVGAPTTLKELGVKEADIPRLAENAGAFAPFGVLKLLNAEDIIEIYKLAY